MTSETEQNNPLPIRKVRKMTRRKTSLQNDGDNSLADQILTNNNTKLTHPKSGVKIKVISVPTTEGPQPDEIPKYDSSMIGPEHKARVCAVSVIICIAGVCALILTAYNTAQSLHRANKEISELKAFISTAATTKIPDTKEPKEIILNAIRDKMNLPASEEPVIIRIEDAERIAREQEFYSQVVQGDIVLIYPKARKAIIWSPSRSKIVNAGIIATQDPVGNADNATTTANDQW